MAAEFFEPASDLSRKFRYVCASRKKDKKTVIFTNFEDYSTNCVRATLKEFDDTYGFLEDTHIDIKKDLELDFDFSIPETGFINFPKTCVLVGKKNNPEDKFKKGLFLPGYQITDIFAKERALLNQPTLQITGDHTSDIVAAIANTILNNRFKEVGQILEEIEQGVILGAAFSKRLAIGINSVNDKVLVFRNNTVIGEVATIKGVTTTLIKDKFLPYIDELSELGFNISVIN